MSHNQPQPSIQVINIKGMIEGCGLTKSKTFTANGEPIAFVMDHNGIPLFAGNPKSIYDWLTASRDIPSELATLPRSPQLISTFLERPIKMANILDAPSDADAPQLNEPKRQALRDKVVKAIRQYAEKAGTDEAKQFIGELAGTDEAKQFIGELAREVQGGGALQPIERAVDS